MGYNNLLVIMTIIFSIIILFTCIAVLSDVIGATIPVTPRTDVQQLNDREIATGYLLTLKRAGREYAWSAMEASNPELREFLKDAFTMSCNHAYEVYQCMVKNGFYALSPAPQTEIDATGAIFNIGPQ